MLALLIALATASAHPFGARYAAHRVDLHVGSDTISVHYIAEVPNALLTAKRGRDPIDEMKHELLSGLVLAVDGRTVPLEVAGPAEVQQNDDTLQIGLRLRAKLDGPATEITLSDGNLPDVPGVFCATASVGPGISVLESSLLRVRDGAVIRDDSERWHMGPGHRETTLRVAHASTLWTWIGPWSSDERIGVAMAFAPSWTALLGQPIVTPTVAGVAGLVALLSGLASGRDGDWRVAAACWLPALPLAVWLPSPGAEFTAAGIAMAALGAAIRKHRAAPTLLVAGIAIATHALALASMVIALHLLGRRVAPTHHDTLTLELGVLWSARATVVLSGIVAVLMLFRVAGTV